MDLSIIYVNWNSLDFLRESLASVYEHTHNVALEVIVVDNASPESGVNFLKDSFPEVLIIKSEHNLGFAGANNLGFRYSTGQYLLFLNPDTQLVGPAITTMLQRISLLPKAGIIGCKLLNTDLSIQLTSIQTFPTILNQVLDAEYLQLRWPHCPLWNIAPLFTDDVKCVEVEVISGACMLLRREVFEQVGLFSEDYFMYAEDIDLNHKVSRGGFTNYYVADATIIHHGGRSSSRQSVSHWATLMKYRAMRRLFAKTKGQFYGSLYRAAIGCVAMVRLTLLGLAYPLGGIVWNRESIRLASKKWRLILGWAMGRPGLVVDEHQ